MQMLRMNTPVSLKLTKEPRSPIEVKMPENDNPNSPKTLAAEDHLLDLSNTISCSIGRTKAELRALSGAVDRFLEGQPLTQRKLVELGDYLGCISENSILEEPHAAFDKLAAEVKARACQVDALPGNGRHDQNGDNNGDDGNGRRKDPMGELEAIQETLAQNPCSRYVGLIKRTGRNKGEIPDITINQFERITGKRGISPVNLTAEGKVPAEIALYEIADRLGKSTDETIDCVKKAKAMRDRARALKGELRATA